MDNSRELGYLACYFSCPCTELEYNLICFNSQVSNNLRNYSLVHQMMLSQCYPSSVLWRLFHFPTNKFILTSPEISSTILLEMSLCISLIPILDCTSKNDSNFFFSLSLIMLII